MTTTKKTKTANTTESSVDNLPPSANTDEAMAEKSKSSLSAVLKEALAAKNKKQQMPKSTKKIDKGQKIGMQPRGTRKSMGKR